MKWSTIESLSNKLKMKSDRIKYIVIVVKFPRYMRYVQGLKTLRTLSLLSSFSLLFLPKLFLLNFSDSLSLAPSSFYSCLPLFPLFPASLPSARFGGYLFHPSYALPSFDHEGGLLGILLLFKSVIQYWMWLTVGEGLINTEVIAALVPLSSLPCLSS